MMIQGSISAFCRSPDESASSNGDGERFGAYEINVGQGGLLTARMKIWGIVMENAKILVEGGDGQGLAGSGFQFAELVADDDVELQFSRPFPVIGLYAEGVGAIALNGGRSASASFALVLE